MKRMKLRLLGLSLVCCVVAALLVNYVSPAHQVYTYREIAVGCAAWVMGWLFRSLEEPKRKQSADREVSNPEDGRVT